jgi:hypothetical protein
VTNGERVAAALADRYTIERELGAGGMATVYLAADLKHDRQVAIKVLKPELAAVLGAERFVQEIKTTAALQHPHILPLFDSGSADGFLYYVMPYIQGETLRTKLDREKQLGIDEAVKITTEVADALDYAHRHGVIHRDIKPENILLHDGRPMVADFGIALAVSAAAGGRMTETGLSLGTPHYMSPEQATAEKEITARSDVYSLASVLYEMLTGNPPHTGSSAQQIIMKIIAEPVPAVTSLRKSVPLNVAAALMKALEKLPADRFDTAKGFADALANPAFTTQAAAGALGGRSRRGNRLLATTTAVAVVAIVAALAGWLRHSASVPTARFEVALPVGTSLATASGFGTTLAVSPDGALLAFIGVDSGSTSRLWVKREGDLEARPIPGTEGAYAPFFSPDGTQIGFTRDPGRTLNVVAIDGGLPHVILTAGDSAFTMLGTSGASWASDGFIYYDADESGIRRMRPDGGDRQEVLPLDRDSGDLGFAWPEVLPGAEVLIARVRRGSDPPEQFDIVASRIGTGTYRSVGKGVIARYHDGHLFIVAADGTLRATPFDARRLALRERTRLVAGAVRVAGSFAGVDLVVDGRGTLHYVAGPRAIGGTMAWVDFAGRRTHVDPAWRFEPSTDDVRLSADGRQVALVVRSDSGRRIWIKQFPSGPTLPVPLDSGRLIGGGWGADGTSLLLAYRQGGVTVMERQRADGLGRPTTIATDSLFLYEAHESRDGRWIIAVRGDSAGNADLAVLERGRDSRFRPLVVTPADESYPELSPNGRWLAYASDRSGRLEVYVQPFPEVERGIWQVSIDGGANPHWSPAGDRLLFMRYGTGILAVDVSDAPTFGRPDMVLNAAQLTGIIRGLGWGVHPDGRRLLIPVSASGGGDVRLVRIEHVMTELGYGAVP